MKKAYHSDAIENKVMSATPGQLIVILYEELIACLNQSIYGIVSNQPEVRQKNLSKAVSIISDGLRASLDVNKAPEIGGNLLELYNYFESTLVKANAEKSVEKINEVLVLAKELKDAWVIAEQSLNKQGSPQKVA